MINQFFDEIPMEDALECVAMLVQQGRAPRMEDWVPEMMEAEHEQMMAERAEQNMAHLESIF